MSVKLDSNESNALSTLLINSWRIALYLRISQEDKHAGESVSITNQRAMIMDYINRSEEFNGAAIIEYVDDGLSGRTTAREDYARLIQDIDNDKINGIIVKDLSRIGRNMLETDDFLMNYLVERNVRFISLGDNYDSFIHPLSVLELAMINLFNQDYIRDLIEKSASSRLVKVKRGEFVGRYAPFGYVKSKSNKNKLVVDEEAAGYVRLIFSLVIDGHKLREIAEILNAQGIPTPSVYKKTRLGLDAWYTTDPNHHFWADYALGALLRDERYTGKAICKSYAQFETGLLKSPQRAKKDWIVVPGAHEAIVTEEEFKQARRAMNPERPSSFQEHILLSKVRCAACGHTMVRTQDKLKPSFKCRTRLFTDFYSCPERPVRQSVIEQAVMESLKVYCDTLIEREEMKLAALHKSKDSKTVLEGRIKAEQQAIVTLENSITKIFTSFVSNKMTKEAFLSKKETVNVAVAKKKEALTVLETRLAAITTGKAASMKIIADLNAFKEMVKLDRGLIELLIDRIRIHSDYEIEIIWNDRR
jgi:DNA invertase Pin-like site-specific DNA recombinase